MAVKNEGLTWLSKDDFTARVPALREDSGAYLLVDSHGDASEIEVTNDPAFATGSNWDDIKTASEGLE